MLENKRYNEHELPLRTGCEESLHNWLTAAGDLDDFIFWNEQPTACSER